MRVAAMAMRVTLTAVMTAKRTASVASSLDRTQRLPAAILLGQTGDRKNDTADTRVLVPKVVFTLLHNDTQHKSKQAQAHQNTSYNTKTPSRISHTTKCRHTQNDKVYEARRAKLTRDSALDGWQRVSRRTAISCAFPGEVQGCKETLINQTCFAFTTQFELAAVRQHVYDTARV